MILFREENPHFWTHGILLSLILILPLLRAGWDLWSQTAVVAVWTLVVLFETYNAFRYRPKDPPRPVIPAKAGIHRFLMVFPASVLIPLGVYVGAALVSAGVSPFPFSAHAALLVDAPAVAFFLWGASVVKHKDLYRRALAGAGLLAVGAAFFQSTGSFSSPLTGPLLNPNVLVSLLLLTGPGAFFLAMEKERSWFWGVVCGVSVGSVLLSRSWVGCLVLAFQFFWCVRRWGGNRRWLWFLLGFAVVALGLFLARADAHKLFHGDPDRWHWWAGALRMIFDRPWLGVGPGAFGEAYPAYRAGVWGLNTLYAHNFFLELWAERGVVGVGALLFLAKTAFCGERSGLWLGLVGFLLFNLVHIGFSFPALYWLFFLILGLNTTPNDQGEARTASLEEKKIPWVPAAVGAFLWVVVCGASFSLFRSSQCLEWAKIAFKNDQSVLARSWSDQGLRWNPWNPELYELRSALKLGQQDWEGATKDLYKAVALAPAAAGFRVDVAELALQRGDRVEALKQYDEAVRLMPLKTHAWERRGDILAGDGLTAQAKESYSNALRALDDPRVLGGDRVRQSEAVRRVTEKKANLL